MRVAVCGLGLVGGSLARALRKAGHDVAGYDRKRVFALARSAGAVGGRLLSLKETVRRAEVVVLAAPPRANRALLRRIRPVLPPGAVVTDVGSVKGPICALARRLGVPGFVGGHPMAGSAGSGFRASSATLFRGRTWILTPQGAAPGPVRVLKGLIRSVGARPVTLSPAAHDRVVAFLSHVPQLVAYALSEAARKDPVSARSLALAGPGFRDMTRLASSPRALWREILQENRADVDRALRAFRRSLRRRP